MRNRYHRSFAAALILPLLLGGCGTLNIFPFPYPSAAKAADRVLDDILPANASAGSAGDAPARVSEAVKP